MPWEPKRVPHRPPPDFKKSTQLSIFKVLVVLLSVFSNSSFYGGWKGLIFSSLFFFALFCFCLLETMEIKTWCLPVPLYYWLCRWAAAAVSMIRCIKCSSRFINPLTLDLDDKVTSDEKCRCTILATHSWGKNHWHDYIIWFLFTRKKKNEIWHFPVLMGRVSYGGGRRRRWWWWCT